MSESRVPAEGWELIYDLAEDLGHIEDVQRATLTTETFGLVPEPALFGSPGWWAAIRSGELATRRVEGTISRVCWTGMGDWAEFELEQGGEISQWTRQGDPTRYVANLRAKLDYVPMRSRSPVFASAEHPVVVKTWVERSRLRSCDIGPGPGGGSFRDLTTLFRPVGAHELTLIEESGHRRFPPRLAEQPIFYPVLDEAYAVQIARDWNTKDERSGFVGYVTAFHVRTDYLARFEVHEVGGHDRREYWIPAGELDEFNANLHGRIDVTAEFHARPEA